MRARSVKAKLPPLVEIIVRDRHRPGAGVRTRGWSLLAALSAGALVVFILYLGKMYKPMQDFRQVTDGYSKAAVGYERIREVLDTKGEVRDLPGARPAPLQGRDRIRSRRASAMTREARCLQT